MAKTKKERLAELESESRFLASLPNTYTRMYERTGSPHYKVMRSRAVDRKAEVDAEILKLRQEIADEEGN